MNEITHIHLGREQFTIATDAHHALRTYVDEIKKQVANKDVLEEVEARMAELLTERGIDAKKVVLMKDVSYLKEQLGEPADFTDEADPEHHEPAESSTPRRLFRDTDDALVAGVCAGFARYFGIDVVIVRLLFVLLLIFGGGGFLLYIVLWLVIPEAKTKSDRLQMQGKSVTVDSLKEIVDRADLSGAAKRTRNTIAPLVQNVGSLLVKLLGGLFCTVGIVLLLVCMTAGIYMFATKGISVSGVAVFPIGIKESLLLASSLAAAGIVSLIFVLMGVSMTSRKRRVPGWATATIAGLLIVSIAASVALAAVVAPNLQQRINSLHHSQTITTSAFKSVVVQGNDTQYVFLPDTKYELEYHYMGSSTGSITKTITGDTLTINTANFVKPICHNICIHDSRDLEIIIHAPALTAITITGEGNRFRNDAAFTQKDIYLTTAKDNSIELQYLKPGHVLLAASPDQERASLMITGIQTSATPNGELSIYGQRYMFDSVETFELKTDASCVGGDDMVTLTGNVGKVIVNDQVFPTKASLEQAQNSDGRRSTNCIQAN